MKDLLHYIVAALVDNPDEIEIAETEREDGVTLELRVAPGDVGKVIGRGGNIAKDLRAVVKAATQDSRRVTIDILD